jgi:hypothetical protein
VQPKHAPQPASAHADAKLAFKVVACYERDLQAACSISGAYLRRTRGARVYLHALHPAFQQGRRAQKAIRVRNELIHPHLRRDVLRVLYLQRTAEVLYTRAEQPASPFEGRFGVEGYTLPG